MGTRAVKNRTGIDESSVILGIANSKQQLHFFYNHQLRQINSSLVYSQQHVLKMSRTVFCCDENVTGMFKKAYFQCQSSNFTVCSRH